VYRDWHPNTTLLGMLCGTRGRQGAFLNRYHVLSSWLANEFSGRSFFGFRDQFVADPQAGSAPLVSGLGRAFKIWYQK
jgi:hypothetical protein